MRVMTIVGLGAALAVSTSAMAQSFNLDLGTTVVGGAGAGAPTSAFGGAAGQAGFWNNLEGTVALGLNLQNLSGGATGATFTRQTAAGGNFAFNSANTTGDLELLLDDGQDMSGSTGPQAFTFAGLQAGTYTLYTYAVAPDFAGTDATEVVVNGVSLISTGPIPAGGTLTAGITHVVHTGIVVGAGGSITAMIDGSGGGFGTVNGFQLVLVPGPGALALFGLAGLVGSRRRRA